LFIRWVTDDLPFYSHNHYLKLKVAVTVSMIKCMLY
jgi:hypothetical protein